jgi:hypothetical protein
MALRRAAAPQENKITTTYHMKIGAKSAVEVSCSPTHISESHRSDTIITYAVKRHRSKMQFPLPKCRDGPPEEGQVDYDALNRHSLTADKREFLRLWDCVQLTSPNLYKTLHRFSSLPPSCVRGDEHSWFQQYFLPEGTLSYIPPDLI